MHILHHLRLLPASIAGLTQKKKIACLCHPASPSQVTSVDFSRSLRFTRWINPKKDSDRLLPICSISLSVEQTQIEFNVCSIVLCNFLTGWSGVVIRLDHRAQGPSQHLKLPSYRRNSATGGMFIGTKRCSIGIACQLMPPEICASLSTALTIRARRHYRSLGRTPRFGVLMNRYWSSFHRSFCYAGTRQVPLACEITRGSPSSRADSPSAIPVVCPDLSVNLGSDGPWRTQIENSFANRARSVARNVALRGSGTRLQAARRSGPTSCSASPPARQATCPTKFRGTKNKAGAGRLLRTGEVF